MPLPRANTETEQQPQTHPQLSGTPPGQYPTPYQAQQVCFKNGDLMGGHSGRLELPIHCTERLLPGDANDCNRYVMQFPVLHHFKFKAGLSGRRADLSGNV